MSRRGRKGAAPSHLRSAAVALAIASLVLPTAACAQAAEQAKGAPATPQTLAARVAAAKPGEVILLASGDYGAFGVGEKTFAEPGIVIQPAPGAVATFSFIAVMNSTGVTIKGVEVDIKDPQYGIVVGHSTKVTLANLKIHAPTTGGPAAMMLRYASDVTVEDCDIQSVISGINFLDSDHLKLLRNNIHNLQVDAIRGESSNVEVIGNHATGFHPQEGDHPDFIQFWGHGGGPSKSNVIRDNVYVRGDGDPVQGIFIEDNDDLLISGNALSGTMYNGIAMARVNRATVEDNFLQGYKDMPSRIITRGQSVDVVIRNNVATEITTYNDGGQPNPRYREEHNKSIRPANVGDTQDAQAWLAKRNPG